VKPSSSSHRPSEWDYFPDDVDTADQSSLAWWEGLVGRVLETARRLGTHSICSPAIVPRTYSNEYFDLLTNVAAL
jgi:hypothetical protein